jgi:hypothetical protein
MTIDEIIAFVEDLDGVLAVRPGPDDGSPQISWGDTFLYYAPDGVMPTTVQPFATIVTKDCPGDERSRLDRPDAFRLNIAAGKDAVSDRTGHAPCDADLDDDLSVADVVRTHPVYGSAGWLAVVNPGRRTAEAVRRLLREAHHRARARHERRTGPTPS